jgi:4-hydroxybenzoate polyprenyltransferase
MKEYLKLIRIQSTPVTLSILATGYGLSRGTILDWEVLPLLIVGALGHWGFYAMNEYEDRKYDLEAEKYDKPLVSGDVTEGEGLAIVLSLVGASLILAGLLFPYQAFVAFLLAAFLGALYNKRSKIDTLSGLYLGAWGVLILYTGYYFSPV